MVALSPRLDYENHLVRCRALRRVPRVSAMGFTLDEADTGEELRRHSAQMSGPKSTSRRG